MGGAAGREGGGPDKGGAIGRANRDGSGVNAKFIPTPAHHRCGVAIAGSQIYWTSYACKIVPGRGCWWAPSSPAAIARANVDGTGVDDQFITDLAIPRSRSRDRRPVRHRRGREAHLLDEQRGKPQASDNRARKPRRHGCQQALHHRRHRWLRDRRGRRPHLLDERGIHRQARDRTRKPRRDRVNQHFIRTAGIPCGVAVYQGHIYWGQSTGGSAHPSTTIGRANVDGSAVNTQFITGVHGFCGGLAVG